jgi:alpha-galactosidase
MESGSVSRMAVKSCAGETIIKYVLKEAPRSQDRSPLMLDSITLSELLDLLDVPPTDRFLLLDKNRQFWFANGYQSWSPGWERGRRESPSRVRFLKALELYTGPASGRRSGRALAAYGIAYLRTEETYLALVSRALGVPVRFLVDRARCSIGIEADTVGCTFSEGQTIAEVSAIIARGFFPFADSIGRVFRERTPFSRADFLRGESERLIQAVGWESWYNHYNRIDESLIHENLGGLGVTPNIIRELSRKTSRPAVFQIDDGWQGEIGDWEADPVRFPSGMERLGKDISSRGYIPGLWIAPFLVSPRAAIFRNRPQWILRDERGVPVRAGWNPGWGGNFFCLDISLQEVRGHLSTLFGGIINEWGFRFLKLDFLYAGMLHGAHGNPGPAHLLYRDALSPIVSTERSQAGEPVVFLGCGAPLESSLGLFPLMRIGADTRETWDYPLARLAGHEGRPSAFINLKDTLGRAFMNRAMYLNDSDVVFMRSSRCSLSETEKELIAATALMFSSLIMISDDVAAIGGPEESRLTKKTLALSEALMGREYGALMVARDVWRCFSRDGEIRGIINLRPRVVRIGGKDCSGWSLSGRPLTDRALPFGDGYTVEPHAIALWQGA